MKSRVVSAVLSSALGLAGAPAAADELATPGQEAVDLFRERGILTPPGALILEPSFSFVQSSSLNVAIQGYTVIPALVIGLINVSEVQRESYTAGLGIKYGLTSRLEAELTVPVVYREERLRDRKVFEGSSVDLYNESYGKDLGDVEMALRYQLNAGLDDWPYFVANLRIKSRTGEGPFEVEREVLRSDGGEVIGQVLAEQPTGSGFWAVQPSLTYILPADPVVLYGNVGYIFNLSRYIGPEFGRVDPGDAFGFSFGMGVALNERTSFSLGYDHSVVSDTTRENDAGVDAGFDRFHVGTLLFGLRQRIASTSLNLSIGIGATQNAPDVQISVRMPFRVID